MTTYKMLYDTDKKQVGCVLLQAAFGLNHHLVNKFGFHSEGWFTAPTDGMRIYEATQEEWKAIAEMTNKTHAGSKIHA